MMYFPHNYIQMQWNQALWKLRTPIPIWQQLVRVFSSMNKPHTWTAYELHTIDVLRPTRANRPIYARRQINIFQYMKTLACVCDGFVRQLHNVSRWTGQCGASWGVQMDLVDKSLANNCVCRGFFWSVCRIVSYRRHVNTTHDSAAQRTVFNHKTLRLRSAFYNNNGTLNAYTQPHTSGLTSGWAPPLGDGVASDSRDSERQTTITNVRASPCYIVFCILWVLHLLNLCKCRT